MPNRLAAEQSTYLLQHAHNPVDWFAWGDEAFATARQRDKPVLVSIGYSACHWCHVMERESFEDADTAALMNECFVCIKVDREERPDVDAVYMDAVQAIAGNGGWPLNVFVTPDREVFFGGTYYPPRPAYNRPSWKQVLQRMADIWDNRRHEALQQAGQITAFLRNASAGMVTGIATLPQMGECRQMADALLKQADTEMGGFGNAPKFPATMAIGFLLEHYYFTGYQPALTQALLSLDAMMNGGIYDQVGGGFARYATDRDWLIPHFEKMLYDNALLAPLYADAYCITGNPAYRKVAEEIIEFTEHELRDIDGGYYCALDADSEGHEGKYYTWTWDEWLSNSGTPSEAVTGYFGVMPQGNWEGTNILHRPQTMEAIATTNNISLADLQQQVEQARLHLADARKQRTRPGTDNKSLLSWNALMNTALTRCSLAFGESTVAHKYAERATNHMRWMLQTYTSNKGLLHTYKGGITKINAMLDDYAYLVQALLQLSSATGENEWLLHAERLMNDVVEEFSSDTGFFYFTAVNDAEVPVRKIEIHDGATPSGNAVMAFNLWWLGIVMERPEWTENARIMAGKMVDTTMRHAYSYGLWATLIQRMAAGMKVVVAAGEDATSANKKISSNFAPETYLLALKKEISEIPILKSKYFDDSLSIFVCSENACLSPVTSAEQALQLLKRNRMQ